MTPRCPLCGRSAAREDCFVRIARQERPTCRPCWEQVFLDPERVLRQILQPGSFSPRPHPSAP